MILNKWHAAEYFESKFSNLRLCVVVEYSDAPEVFRKFPLPDSMVRLKSIEPGLCSTYFDLPIACVTNILAHGQILESGIKVWVYKHFEDANKREFYSGRTVLCLAI